MRRSECLLLTFLVLLPACSKDAPSGPESPTEQQGPLDPRHAVLVRETGSTPLDQAIRTAQDKVGLGDQLPQRLEQLAVLFIQKARRQSDPGYYKLAEQCASWIEAESPGDASAKLVRGHVLQSLHHFAEAEPVARELVLARGLFLDHGLLGDVLYDLGRPAEALDCYQRMLDLKPCLQSYSRAAQVRWLRGDLHGAAELLELARTSGSVRDPESLAWVNVRLATIALQDGDLERAGQRSEESLALLPDYAAGHHARGLLRAARGDLAAAVLDFEAASANQLPEHLWALADTQRALGRSAEAAATEQLLMRSGRSEDPRSFSLFLASRRLEPALALELARSELSQRHDVLTRDALAWALFAAGNVAEAAAAMPLALAEGTRDGRLLLHAGAIALANGETAAARAQLRQAFALRLALLPGERDELQRLRAEVGES